MEENQAQENQKEQLLPLKDLKKRGFEENFAELGNTVRLESS